MLNLITLILIITSHGSPVISPIGPWPEGYIRTIRSIPIFWDNHVDGVPK